MKRVALRDEASNRQLDMSKKPNKSAECSTQVTVNYLPLNLDELYNKIIYKIDFRLTPEPKSDSLYKMAQNAFNEKNYPSVVFAFDGKYTMYTTKEFKGKTDTVTIPGRNNKPSVTFLGTASITNVIDMSLVKEYVRKENDTIPEEGIRAMLVVLENERLGLPNGLRYGLGTLKYNNSDNISSVINFDNLRDTFFNGWKPYLNVKYANRIYTKGRKLLSVMQDDLNLNIHSELDAETVYKLEQNIKGIKVEYASPLTKKSRGVYKVNGLHPSAGKFTFEVDNHRILEPGIYTVAQYFELGENYTIQYPYLPCLMITRRNIAIPIELCTVTTEYLNLKGPSSTINESSHKNIGNPVLQEFGVRVGERMAHFTARVLEEPTLTFAHNQKLKPKSGNWKAHHLAESAVLESWAIVHLDSGTLTKDHIRAFEREFLTCAQHLNIAVKAPNHILTCNLKETKYRPSEMKNMVFNAITTCRDHNIRLIVVIIPAKIQQLYEFVKQTAELDVGILTQCVKDDTVKISTKLYMRNFLLKINSKLDGVNHKIANYSVSMEGTIIFGGYISSPPNSPNSLTEAAVAATQDLDGIKYGMAWRTQPAEERFICDLEDMVHQHLVKYAANTGRLPTKVIFYRDGWDARALIDCAEEEVSMLRRACLRVDPAYRPPINFIVVQKRCQTRVFSSGHPTNSGAVPTGTVVDTHIVGPQDSHFYLCSKADQQISTMPTKYTTVWNDSDFTNAQLEQITFDLCYMSLVDTNSTAHPAPVRYARLATKRARIYVKCDEYSSSASTSRGSMAEEDIQTMVKSEMTNKSPMYFV